MDHHYFHLRCKHPIFNNIESYSPTTMKVFVSSISVFLWSWLIASATAEPAKCLKILLTNDDGYSTLFIQTLFELLRKDTCHDVIMSAPKEGQSGTSAKIDSFVPVFDIGNPEDGVYYVDTTPAGAVHFGLDVAAPENNFVPDLVISGPNEGWNMGHVTVNSGTVGAAVSAMAKGFPAIAVSGSINDQDDEECATMIAKLICTFIDTKLIDGEGNLIIGQGEGFNMNIPTVKGGTGEIVDYEFKLTEIGLAYPYGGFRFYQDFADSELAQLLAGDALNGFSGIGSEIDMTLAGYPEDTNPNSERNAFGVNIFDPQPTYVVTVSPIKFNYGADASPSVKRAFRSKATKSVKKEKKEKVANQAKN